MLDSTPTSRVQTFLSKFEAALTAQDLDRRGQSVRRGMLLARSRRLHLEHQDDGRPRRRCATCWRACLARVKPHDWRVAEGEAATESGGVTEAWITFETEVARGYGLMRLKDGHIWTLLTTMVELKGYEEKAGFTRPLGAKHGVNPGAKTWKELRDEEAAKLGFETQPYVLIIGGGQGGIALGARLRQLGVPTIIVEKNERAGDSWRKRYKSLCLHDPVWYDHLPYIDFPKNWPVFSPKDKIGDWLEMYAKVMELNYWTQHDRQDAPPTTRRRRNGPSSSNATARRSRCDPSNWSSRPACRQSRTCRTSRAWRPFKGEQHHSSQHPGPDGYKGKKVVVIGSNNSAHDICAALYEAGVDVTMVQRSTHAYRALRLADGNRLGRSLFRARGARRHDDRQGRSDLRLRCPIGSWISSRTRSTTRSARSTRISTRPSRRRASSSISATTIPGLFMKYLRRGSGYYIDIGASQLIIDGKIKLVAGQVEEITAARRHARQRHGTAGRRHRLRHGLSAR